MPESVLIYNDGSMVASFANNKIVIFEKDCCDENIPYVPAKSLTVYGKTAIVNLCEFLNECKKEMDSNDPF